MIANYHFMVRDFINATKELEETLRISYSKKTIKKLIICYTQTERFQDALELFYNLINEDIDYLINTDIENDGCPCPQLISIIENSKIKFPDEFTHNYVLGILWLYCDIHKSHYYFNSALILNPADRKMNNIITIIEKKIKQLEFINNTKIMRS